ncbi:MAG: hypothetical protein ACOC1X_04590 [Promethearchaeota archaeon]
MLKNLKKLIDTFSLSDIDNTSNFEQSDYFHELLKIFPDLRDIFKFGINQDIDEFNRTFGHILRTLKLYFILRIGNLKEEKNPLFERLVDNSISLISEKINKQTRHNELIIPLILVFHDIGRFYDKRTHPKESYRIVKERNLLNTFPLDNSEKLLILKAIEHHLLIATIFTGESTFYSTYTLLNDKEFHSFGNDKKILNRFLEILEIFTYLDIMGYSYSRIYNHYISYYQKINEILKRVLYEHKNKEHALKLALDYSEKYIEWRIAGALRIFQFIETEPHLTKQFYFQKLKDSIKNSNLLIFQDSNWKHVRKNILASSKIQIKYGLGVLMLFAFGNFFRKGLDKNSKVSDRLLLFWILLSKKINKISVKNPSYLWNVYFIGTPNWAKYNRSEKFNIKEQDLRLLIENSTHQLDRQKKEYKMYLNVAKIFE